MFCNQRVSYDLEASHVVVITAEDVQNCSTATVLNVWADELRKKWVLTKRFEGAASHVASRTDSSFRTIESRTKHHRLFYSGGDESHLAYISSLGAQKEALEDMLFRIDDRAYAVGLDCLHMTKLELLY